jgi:hypothetical protein
VKELILMVQGPVANQNISKDVLGPVAICTAEFELSLKFRQIVTLPRLGPSYVMKTHNINNIYMLL